tara:strand:+ start:159 stop:314 length:156 start_codon:yes stop_codon:yes gene_type:complete
MLVIDDCSFHRQEKQTTNLAEEDAPVSRCGLDAQSEMLRVRDAGEIKPRHR